MKKFSIVIITYQGRNLLVNALEALSHQKGFSKDDYEIVVVDDGSSDGTREAIEQIYKHLYLKYIYLERNEDSCIARTRNAGFMNAEGEYIIFLDGDIIVKENYLMELHRCFTMEENIMVTCPRIMLQEEVSLENVKDKSIYSKAVFDRENKKQFEVRDFAFEWYSYNAAAYRYPWLIMFGFSIAIHRKWLEKYGGFDQWFKGWGVEDTELFYRMYKNGIRPIINSRLEVLHQYHGNHKVVDESKYPDIERNVAYLYEKHPDIDIPMEHLCNHYKEKAKIHLGFELNYPSGTKMIQFKDREELDMVKEQIISLSGISGYELIVLDYVEDSDLDIWIQLIGKRNSKPKYYPVSRKIFIEN